MNRLALISVSDKTGVVAFAQGLVARGFTVLSTGGTKQALVDAGVPVVAVSAHTGASEIFGGRVKTLHPRVHGGILARRGVDDAEAEANDIPPIDVVAVNLYPFEATVARGAGGVAGGGPPAPEVALEEAVEQIDIGGPAMVRAAAKNHAAVRVVVDPADYDAVLAELDAPSGASRLRLAVKAFRHTAAYDAVVSGWLASRLVEEESPAELAVPLRRVQSLRYGENPHQGAAFYAVPLEGGRSLARARQLQGKELSFNNFADLDATLRVTFEFELPAAVIVKHTNPCGVAEHPGGAGSAYRLALSADPVSAYGGILAFNRPITGEVARAIVESKVFYEVIAAPGVDDEARAALAKRTNLRVMELPDDWSASVPDGRDARRVQGGWLVQDWDVGADGAWTSALRAPTVDERRALRFAWRVCRNVKSNAIVLARADADGSCVTNGIGAGQTSRVDAVRLAVARATRAVAGAVLASDAFFPFADGVDAAAAAGITAIVQPGGSIRDDEVRAAAAASGMAMEITGVRHFRH